VPIQSAPICRRIRRVIQRWYLSRRFLPQSTMGTDPMGLFGALSPATGNRNRQQPGRERNLARSPGKKNWLFFGDADAGHCSAIIYSVIESCHRHGVEPYTYLSGVLTRLPSMTVPATHAEAHRPQVSLTGSSTSGNPFPIRRAHGRDCVPIDGSLL
jgi:IS66 C-terminal element